MKKLYKIIFGFLAVVIAFNCMPTFAKVSPQEMRSEQYLINQGYSKETARMVNLQHHQANGKAVEKEESVSRKLLLWPVRMFKKAHSYIDPAVDDGSFGNTKIDFQPVEYKNVPNL